VDKTKDELTFGGVLREWHRPEWDRMWVDGMIVAIKIEIKKKIQEEKKKARIRKG